MGFRAGLGAGALVARSSAGAAGQVTLTNARFSKNVAGSSGPALYLRAGTAARLTGVSAPTGADAGTPTAGSLRPNTVVDQPPDTPAIAVDAQPSASGNLSSQANVFSAGPRVVGLANRGTAPAEALAVAPTPRVENGRFSAIREVRGPHPLRNRRHVVCRLRTLRGSPLTPAPDHTPAASDVPAPPCRTQPSSSTRTGPPPAAPRAASAASAAATPNLKPPRL